MTKEILYKYQRNFINGANSRQNSLWLSSRQIGKSFDLALWGVFRALEIERHLVVLLSSGKNQSQELMEKAVSHNEFMGRMGASLHEEFFEDTKIKQLELRFANKSRIIGLPSNPRTARGYSGDIGLDEFAFHEDNKKIWQSMYPSITKGYKAVVTSTAQGKNDMFYHLATEAEKDPLNWYYQKTTIYDAVADGYPVDAAKLKAGIKDEDIWATEYMCEFMDAVDAILTYELIESCESPDVLIEDIRSLKGDVYLGIDIGRRKDLTVVAIFEMLGDVLYLRKLVILRNLSFKEQFDTIDHLLNYARRAAIDETGIGMNIAEDLVRKWGDTKVVPVYFTAKSKEEMTFKLKSKFTDRAIRIPIDTDLREDLHSVRKMVSKSGNIVISAERTDLGHADRFYGLALGVHAANMQASHIYIPSTSAVQVLCEQSEIDKAISGAAA